MDLYKERLPVKEVEWLFGNLADHCEKQGTLRSRHIENTQKLGNKCYSSFLQCQISPELRLEHLMSVENFQNQTSPPINTYFCHVSNIPGIESKP